MHTLSLSLSLIISKIGKCAREEDMLEIKFPIRRRAMCKLIV